MNFFSIAWSKPLLKGNDPTKLIANAYFPCYIRATPQIQTYIDLHGKWFGDAASNYTVYGVLGGTRVIAGVIVAQSQYGARVEFSPLAHTQVDGFEIELNSGLGSSLTGSVTTPLSSGSVVITTTAGTTVGGMTIGNHYAAQNTGGPWYGYPVGHPLYAPLHYMSGKNHNGKVLGTIGDGFAGLGTLGLLSYVLSAEQSIVYFVAEAASIDFWTTDPNPSDNTGSLSYILWNAAIIGRQIQLSPATLHNVCAG